jgi:hypothetical protein
VFGNLDTIHNRHSFYSVGTDTNMPLSFATAAAAACASAAAALLDGPSVANFHGLCSAYNDPAVAAAAAAAAATRV